jgi:hypothetical protein
LIRALWYLLCLTFFPSLPLADSVAGLPVLLPFAGKPLPLF